MRYGILGPLEVSRAGRPVTPSTPQPRTVLTALLANANRWVPVLTLVDELWPQGAPRTGRVIVQVAVSKLRKALCPGVGVDSPAQLIRTGRAGYLLSVAGGEFDQDEFVLGAQRGQQLLLEERPEAAREVFSQALRLWRGEALADVECGPVLAAHAQWLSALRLSTLDSRVRVDLALGRHQLLIPELRALLAEDPGQEPLAGSLIVALHRAGRAAEADEVLAEVRDHLGADPGPQLRRVHGDPSTWELPKAVVRTSAASGQIPPQVADFTGREGLLARISPELGSAPIVLCGPGGVGKTTLAVAAAHRWRERFPDGQLFARLRGSEQVDVLGRFLISLGVKEVPGGLPERQQLFRGLTLDRRVLVVLDDAVTEAQVRALLPSGRDCGVIVTARGRLTGLEGARPFEVDALSEQAALGLLGAVAGPERVAAEAVRAAELVRLCGFLPLAVRIAGAKLAARPHELISDLLARITDERRRLGELRTGDLDVRATLEVGYLDCGPAQRRVLKALGLLDSADLPVWAVAAMLDLDAGTTAELLDGLVDASLLQVVGRDRLGQLRYRPHELIRVFGHDRLLAEDSSSARAELVDRLLGAYCDRADSLQGTESTALPCLVEVAHRYRRWHAASVLAQVCPPRNDSRRIDIIGLVAARVTGDRRAQAVSLRRLGDLHWEGHGRARRAHVYYDMACRIFAELDDHVGLGRALASRADIDVERGEIERAHVSLRRGLVMLRAVDDRCGQVDLLRQLGSLHADRGDLAEAKDCFNAALDLAVALGDERRRAQAAKQLADLLRRTGETDRAGELLETALRVSSRGNDDHWTAHVLRSMGELERSCGNLATAEVCLTRSLGLFEELGHRHATAYTVRSLGELSRQRGDEYRALTLLTGSLATFVDLDDRRGRAYALLGLGPVRHELGDAAAGVAALRESARLFDGLGFPVWHAQALDALGRLAVV
ncbi:AfsR/SARP family transcriptional regulator, partial [Kutzneria albida]|uniref:SARP family transcription regulator n=1 Tax=Kutzneria albida DSM 43870 TaxID=1449976 RepID=W5W304_9PSEU